MKKLLSLILVSFVFLCSWLVVGSAMNSRSGLHRTSMRGANGTDLGRRQCILLQQTVVNKRDAGAETDPSSSPKANLERADSISFDAYGGLEKSVTLGSTDPAGNFNFQLELSSKGAAIRKVAFSKFDDRDYKNPQPLAVLSPLTLTDGSEILSMANKEFVLVEQQLQFRLNELHWESYEAEKAGYGSETARFQVLIKSSQGQPIIKLIKTYTVVPNSYLLDCSLTLENLSASEQKVRFNLAGPIGIGREAIRTDMRNIVGGFLANGQIVSSRRDLLVGFPMNLFSKSIGLKTTTREYQQALQFGDQAQIRKAKDDLRIGRNLPDAQKQAHFLWVATSNKYFTTILRPLPNGDAEYCTWIKDKTGFFYNPDGDPKADTGDETIGVNLEIAPVTLAPAAQYNSLKTYKFQLYIGPKDKSLFDKNELYKSLGFINTITLMPCCCCPASIIRPLALGILALMKWLYSFIGNYGVVIIVLVFLVRLAMHPITKKSQVSMSRFTKVLNAPEVQQIRKKYAKNQVEMNKRILAYQKERGISPATPIMGMLPMFAQMPIWLALYSAIFASIELRGAAFLPVWITDLSAPDALFRFNAVTLPLFGKLDSFNLLPILMGLAFYLQQKLTPSQAAASASPQAAQQQKMMMIMMPVFLPLLLYKGPSGLNLYIMSSVFAGAIEQYFIRKHLREKDAAESVGVVAVTQKTGGKVKKKKPKPFYKI